MSPTHKSQSALEYMMTYGWAILIIVIVAGVLYSFGVFNPSSSASATITGFSGLGVTQAACVNSVNNQILELYVSNSIGYPVNVTKINVTDNNGISLSQNVSSILGAGIYSIYFFRRHYGFFKLKGKPFYFEYKISFFEITHPVLNRVRPLYFEYPSQFVVAYL